MIHYTNQRCLSDLIKGFHPVFDTWSKEFYCILYIIRSRIDLWMAVYFPCFGCDQRFAMRSQWCFIVVGHATDLDDGTNWNKIIIPNGVCAKILSDLICRPQITLGKLFWVNYGSLTHWGQSKMAATFQMTFSNRFSWMKMYEFWLKFNWSLFLGVQLTMFQHSGAEDKIFYKNKVNTMATDAWLPASPGYQQSWHWLGRINMPLSSIMMNFNP